MDAVTRIARAPAKRRCAAQSARPTASPTSMAPTGAAPPPRRPALARSLPASTTALGPGRAPRHEVELLEVLLAEPSLVARAQDRNWSVGHRTSRIRELLEGLYRVQSEGRNLTWTICGVGWIMNALLKKAFVAQQRGLDIPDRSGRLQSVLMRFRERRMPRQKTGAAPSVAVGKGSRHLPWPF